jgi:hypothetical protein
MEIARQLFPEEFALSFPGSSLGMRKKRLCLLSFLKKNRVMRRSFEASIQIGQPAASLTWEAEPPGTHSQGDPGNESP